MRTSRNLKGQPGKLKERQGAPTGYYYYILQLRRVGLRLYRSSFPELSLPEGAGGAEAAARRNSARLKIKGWVQSYFVQKPIKATEDGRSMTSFYYCSVNHQSGLQRNTFSKLSYIFLIHQNVPQIMSFHLRYMMVS